MSSICLHIELYGFKISKFLLNDNDAITLYKIIKLSKIDKVKRH